MNWILSKLFGTNWETNLLNAFKIAADEQIASNPNLSESTVDSWATAHVTTIASEIAKGNPLEAAMLIGAADIFLPSIVSSLYASLLAKTGVSAPVSGVARANV